MTYYFWNKNCCNTLLNYADLLNKIKFSRLFGVLNY